MSREARFISLDDGTQMLVCGVDGDRFKESLEAFKAVAAAAKAKLEHDHPYLRSVIRRHPDPGGVTLTLNCGHAVLRPPSFSVRARQTDCEECARAAQEGDTDG